jgi:hypothetical protein
MGDCPVEDWVCLILSYWRWSSGMLSSQRLSYEIFSSGRLSSMRLSSGRLPSGRLIILSLRDYLLEECPLRNNLLVVRLEFVLLEIVFWKIVLSDDMFWEICLLDCPQGVCP